MIVPAYELPVCVRLALWATDAWSRGASAQSVLERAMPDLDAVTGELDRLELWAALGEQALFVALPHPGDPTSLPACSLDAAHAATSAGEAVFVTGLGGLLVPQLSEYGPANDVGTAVHWTSFDSEPTPRHRLEMLDLREAERTLLAAVRSATSHLEEAEGQPWAVAAASPWRTREWSLPERTPGTAASLLVRAASVGVMAQAGLDQERHGAALSAAASGQRERALRALNAAADQALVTATNVAVMHLAGWRSGG